MKLTALGSSAFDGCRALTGVAVPDSVTGMISFVFSCCKQPVRAIIPDSVQKSGGCLFNACREDPVIITPPGSPAAEYAKLNKLPCRPV